MTLRFNSVEVTKFPYGSRQNQRLSCAKKLTEAVRNTQLLPPRGISCFGRAQKQRHFVFVRPAARRFNIGL
jgi:hypothetical protein